jgi:ribosomal protein L7/L12
MVDNEVYARLGTLEQLVKHLYEKTGVPIPDLQSLARTAVSARVQQLVASGDKMGAIVAYRQETNVDLATAKKFIDSL